MANTRTILYMYSSNVVGWLLSVSRSKVGKTDDDSNSMRFKLKLYNCQPIRTIKTNVIQFGFSISPVPTQLFALFEKFESALCSHLISTMTICFLLN